MSRLITLDGPAGSGKGTLAKAVAEHFNLPHLDTGLIYRALAKQLEAHDWNGADAQAETMAQEFRADWLSLPGLRTLAIGDLASRVAAKTKVRAALITFQKRFAEQPGGAVLDGRDTGTVIAPQAPLKLFITASPQARANRRTQELRAQGENVRASAVLEQVTQRDIRDANRQTAPMVPAQDAIQLDTSNLSIAEAQAMVIALAEARFAHLKQN